jgi:hypothetical protein
MATMSGALLYDFGGLVTAPGLLARNNASCIQAVNFRFPQPGLMRKRQGFALGAATAGVNETFTSLMSTPDLAASFYAMGGGTGVRELYRGSPTTSWFTIADTSASCVASARKARLATCGGSTYVCNESVRRIQGSAYRAAGMPRGLPPFTYSMNPAVYSVLNGAGGYLPDGANAAYRVTYHVKVNGVELGGAPTSRLIIRNIAGTSGYAAAVTQQVRLRIPVPYEQDSWTQLVSTSHFYRLWRSRVATGADTADDEMYLVGEAFFTATDITNGYAVFTDLTPDTFLYGQSRLNTNSSNYPPLESGLVNGQTYADEPPPRCNDIAEFAGCMWYAAPINRFGLNLRLLSASFVAGDTVTINGQVCTAVAGVPVNPGDFTIVTVLASLSLNIEATARNLVDAYNRTTARATAQGHYISQGSQAPGMMFFEGQRNQVFQAQSAAAGALFQPNITTATPFPSTLSNFNVVYFSKPGRPDAVPPINAITVGPSGARIERIVMFRERLLCFSTAGIYQITGTDFNNFTPSLVDGTARIFQQESVVIQEDACFAWCYSGIVRIDDGGTQVISNRIEPNVASIFAQTYGIEYGTIFGDGFAVADKTNHIVYFFYTLGGTGQANCAQWLEYDARNDKWSTGATTDGTGRGCGEFQQSTGLLALGNGSSNQFAPTGVAKAFIQRNAMNATTDYTDDTPLGVAQAIQSTALFQLQLPDPDARQHWQQLLLQFENGEFAPYVRPSGVQLSWTTDVVSLAGGASYPLTSAILRVETPATARRATRQQVQLRHVLGESCGLIILNQSMRMGGSRYPK